MLLVTNLFTLETNSTEKWQMYTTEKNLKKPLVDTINVNREKKFFALIMKTMKHYYLRMCTDRLSIADLPDYETNGNHFLMKNN